MKTFKQNTVTRKLKNNIYTLALIGMISSTAICSPAFSAEKTISKKIETQVQQQAQKQTEKKRQEIMTEALSALHETENALKNLDENKPKEALSALEKAMGKLDIILARNPDLSFIPVAVSSKLQNIIVSTETVNDMVNEAKRLLNNGRVQDARILLSKLASERDITVTSIPMATYPIAMKEAAALIEKDKIQQAKIVLQTALNTLAADVTIIPIPVANAQILLAKAETLIKTENRTDEQNQEISNILEAAKKELKFAEALGYGKKKDFTGFYKEIESIQKKTNEGQSGEGFFEKIIGYMKSITKDSQPKPKN